MQGPGDYVSEDGSICYDNIFDYDSWEYFDGELKGKDRILKTISSLKKGNIDINLFINVIIFFLVFSNRRKQPGVQ